MSIIHRICGENFKVIVDHKFGKCFEQLCLIYPAFCVLLISSSYFIAYSNIRHAKRPPLERIVIFMRIFISLLMSSIEFYFLYNLYIIEHNRVSSDLIQAILVSCTWIVHAFYLKTLLRGITHKMRGPLSINICVFLCFAVTSLHLYMQCKVTSFQCLKIFDIIILICQIIYLFTLLPNNCINNGIIEQSINSVNGEEEPLLSSTACRYSAFHEECDPEDLGTAEEANNIFSKLFFIWVKPLMLKGFCNNLKTVDDLFDLPETLQPQNISEKIRISNVCMAADNSETKSFHLIRKLHTFFGVEFYSIGILKFVSDCLLFGGPVLLNALVSNLEDPGAKHPENGYYYAFGLFLTTFIGAVCSAQYNYLISRISLKIKATLIMIVYQKTLFTSKVTLSSMSTGEILNFISTDTDRIVNFCQSFHQFWSLPVQVVIALVLLYQQVNYCFIIGVVFMLIVIPINQYIAKKIANYSTFLMLAKDKRIKLMNEILSGIRTIKMNTWEKIFSGKLKAARHSEVKYLKKRKYLDALCVYFWATTPVVMSFLTFTLYSSLGYKLSAATVFTSISLFNILIMPLNAFPWVLNGLMEAWVSLKRVNSFLQLATLDLKDYYTQPNGDDIKLEIMDGIFSYAKEANDKKYNEQSASRSSFNNKIEASHSCIGPMSFKVSEGDLVCIIGKVGSGKSSLLSSILADMYCVSGEINMDMSDRKKGIGYVSQNPWIQQKSVKDNILFGNVFNSMRYSRVLESCALVDDLKALPYGDNTKVGDKGVTLSGGQKARIALARAVYQDFDIYLLDDPFSAVDAHVADHIFSNCVMGLLKNKTRILCTHKTKFAESANYLLIFSDGKIVSQGPPAQTLQLYFMNENSELMTDDFEDNKEVLQEIMSENENLSEESKEEKEEGVVKFHVYKCYWKAIGTSLSILVLIFCFLMQASKTISDWWLSFWVSNIRVNELNVTNELLLASDHSYQNSSLTFYLSVYGGLAAANSVFALFRAFLFAIAGIKAAILIHDQLLNNIIKAKISFFDVTPLGRILNRFSSDIYCIDDTLPFVMNILLAQLFSLIGCVIITCYGLPWILALILVLSVLYFKIQNYYRRTSRELKRLSSISLSPIYAHFSETLSGHSTIRALASCTKFQKDNMDYLDCNLRTVLAITAASQWLNLRLQFIGVIIITGVALIALIQREFGDVDAGLIGLALSYALSITSLLNGSITSFTETEKEIVSVERVMQYVENVEPESDTYLQLPPFAWPSHGVITFTNVSLRYRPSCPYALKDINFETKPGEKIGIVGRTGSGKSSLIQVLCRMVDTFEGTVFIDGVNIPNLGLKKLRSSLSVIPQEPFLFSGSVRENLDPNYLHSDTEIWKALKNCHVEEKLQNIGGLDVRIEETGQNFSNGERQLICLARAMLQRSKILCMDEATASIDYQTDSLIRHTVRMAFRHSTIIIIAHRMETVMDCDRVLVMKNGEICEFAKPSNLLSDLNSEFYKLVYSKSN